MVEGVTRGVPLIVTQTPHGVTTMGQAPAALQPGTVLIHQSVARPAVSRPSVVRLHPNGRTWHPALHQLIQQLLASTWSYVVEGPAGGAPLVVTRTADQRTSRRAGIHAPAPLGYAPGAFVPEGVNVGIPAATITHEPRTPVLDSVAGGAPLIVTQTPQGVTTITRAPPAVPVDSSLHLDSQCLAYRRLRLELDLQCQLTLGKHQVEFTWGLECSQPPLTLCLDRMSLRVLVEVRR